MGPALYSPIYKQADHDADEVPRWIAETYQ